MKSALTQLSIAMALVAIAMPFAKAQSLRADVPFAFRAAGQTLPAGAYRVELAGRFSEVVVLTAEDGSRAVVLLPTGGTSLGRATISTGEPKLTFECGNGRCALIQLWTGSGAQALTFPQPRTPMEARPILAEVRLH